MAEYTIKYEDFSKNVYVEKVQANSEVHAITQLVHPVKGIYSITKNAPYIPKYGRVNNKLP